jgi:hypothetical protein
VSLVGFLGNEPLGLPLLTIGDNVFVDVDASKVTQSPVRRSIVRRIDSIVPRRLGKRIQTSKLLVRGRHFDFEAVEARAPGIISGDAPVRPDRCRKPCRGYEFPD